MHVITPTSHIYELREVQRTEGGYIQQPTDAPAQPPTTAPSIRDSKILLSKLTSPCNNHALTGPQAGHGRRPHHDHTTVTHSHHIISTPCNTHALIHREDTDGDLVTISTQADVDQAVGDLDDNDVLKVHLRLCNGGSSEGKDAMTEDTVHALTVEDVVSVTDSDLDDSLDSTVQRGDKDVIDE